MFAMLITQLNQSINFLFSLSQYRCEECCRYVSLVMYCTMPSFVEEALNSYLNLRGCHLTSVHSCVKVSVVWLALMLRCVQFFLTVLSRTASYFVSRVLSTCFISAAAIGASCSFFLKFLITLFYGKVDLQPHGLFIHVYAVF